MNRIDYELGFASADGSWNNADGLGAAKAVLVGCNTKCNAAHPFSRTKRDACKAKCTAVYNAKINMINATRTAVESATDAALTQQMGNIATEIIPSPPPAPNDSTKVSEEVIVEEGKSGMSTGMKVGIGVGVIALIIVGVIILKKKK